MKIKAFTLAEAMVMIAVLGVITAVAIPTLVKKDFKTDTGVRAASKAYATLTQVVSNIVQDGYYYKKFDQFGLGDHSVGVDVLTGKQYGGTGAVIWPAEKFKDILIDSLHVPNKSTCPTFMSSGPCVFDTPDGMRWKLVGNANTFDSLEKPLIVLIDTNIKNGVDFECNNLDKCKVIDTAAFLVYRNGNVIIDGAETNAKIGVKADGTLGKVSEFNDEDFLKKILGQHEDTAIVSSDYYNK